MQFSQEQGTGGQQLEATHEITGSQLSGLVHFYTASLQVI